jgi:hypothetical protein
MVAQRQQAERTHAAKAALRDAATEPIESLLLEQQAEAARIQNLLHELRNLSASLDESERKYEELVRRTGRVLGRAADPSSDADEADSDDGATEGSAGEGGDGRVGLRGRRAGRKPLEPERQHAVAAAMLILRGSRFGILLLLPFAGFLIGLQESTNFWDAVIDPFFAIFSILAVIATTALRSVKSVALTSPEGIVVGQPPKSK